MIVLEFKHSGHIMRINRASSYIGNHSISIISANELLVCLRETSSIADIHLELNSYVLKVNYIDTLHNTIAHNAIC